MAIAVDGEEPVLEKKKKKKKKGILTEALVRDRQSPRERDGLRASAGGAPRHRDGALGSTEIVGLARRTQCMGRGARLPSRFYGLGTSLIGLGG